jgi:hypothetical protein
VSSTRRNGEPNKAHTRHLLPSMRPLIGRWRDSEETVWVYVIECEGFTKVGIAQQMESRLKAMQSGNPFPIHVVFSARIPAKIASDVERAAMVALERDHHHGEWFRAAPREALAAVSEAMWRFEEKVL